MSLTQLVRERNEKRQRCSAIFKEKQALEARKRELDAEMEKLQEDLMTLDERIDYIQEGGGGNDAQQQAQVPQEQPQHLTMHPEEILPEEPSLNNSNSLYAVARQAGVETLTVDDDGDNGFITQRIDVDFSPEPVARRPQQASLAPLFRQHQNTASTTTTIPDCPFSKEEITNVLQNTFSIPNFRENQLEIIQATLSGQDCFVIMRTGGGKSLTYQLPVVLERPKITLVISPLLSLIQDQQQQMNQFLEDACVSFTSGMGTAEHTENWRRVRDPNKGVGMILVTPEKVHKSNKLKSELEKLYDQGRLARFVIDECHCACQWGHDFRPDYAKLGLLKHHFPSIPVLAVTATASGRVREDCCKILKISRNYRFFRSSANRPNLHYQVRAKHSPAHVIEDMVHFIKTRHPDSAGIIYTYSRKDADTVADQLLEHGIEAEAYHSDVSASQKNRIHYSWMHNVTKVIVATIAFGLGINKPDVRFVLHHTLSKTLEAYYQESGRAGRDGRPADCILYYAPKDVPRMIKMVHGESSESLFWNMVQYGQRFGSDRLCRAILLQHLGEANQHLPQALAAEEPNDSVVQTKDVTSHAKTVLQLLYLKQDDNVTMAMLVKEWRAKPASAPECVQNNPPGKDLSVSDCEHIVIALLVQGLLQINVQWTSYDSVVYLRCNQKTESFLISDRQQLKLRLPKAVKKAATSAAAAATKRKTATSSDGWIQTNNNSTKKPKKASTTAAATKRKRTVRKKQPATRKKKAPTKKKPAKKASSRRKSAPAALAPRPPPNGPDVISLDDDDDDDGYLSEDFGETTSRAVSSSRSALPRRPQRTVLTESIRASQKVAARRNDDNDPLWDDESDEENEF